jgi:hypothetical protein
MEKLQKVGWKKTPDEDAGSLFWHSPYDSLSSTLLPGLVNDGVQRERMRKTMGICIDFH